MHDIDINLFNEANFKVIQLSMQKASTMDMLSKNC